MSYLEVKNLKKVYTTHLNINKVVALSNVNFTVEEGEYVAVMGESGSGKTTLLNILAAIIKATDGTITLDGKNLTSIREKDLAKFRRENLGFVFQDFNLLDTLTVQDNIYLPLVLSNTKYSVMSKKMMPLAKYLGIEELLTKYPYEISGGQKQRVAIARALITNPKLLLADEPTGALDSKSSDEILKLFKGINDKGNTIFMVTHSIKAASTANRVLFIKDGTVFHQIYRSNESNEMFYERISDVLTLLQRGNEIK